MKNIIIYTTITLFLLSCSAEISEKIVLKKEATVNTVTRLKEYNAFLQKNALGTRTAWGRAKQVFKADGAAFNAAFHDVVNQETQKIFVI